MQWRKQNPWSRLELSSSSNFSQPHLSSKRLNEKEKKKEKQIEEEKNTFYFPVLAYKSECHQAKYPFCGLP